MPPPVQRRNCHDACLYVLSHMSQLWKLGAKVHRHDERDEGEEARPGQYACVHERKTVTKFVANRI
jgi:hypothetical protein